MVHAVNLRVVIHPVQVEIMSKPTPLRYSAVAIAVLIGLSACGEGKDKKTATQVAAKVNGSEISVHQINAILPKLPGVPADAVLDKLIEQQLAYDQAIEKKLDRTPEVMLAIETAKREIIARAYLDQLIATQAKPTDDEVKAYYAANPDLFARRRIYNLQELTLEKRPDDLDALKQAVAGARFMDEIAAWLKARNINFRPGAATTAAEQVPLEILPKIAEIKDGQIALIDAGKNILIVRVVSSQSAPVDEATAKPRIQQFLFNSKAQKFAAEEIKKLRAAAKIERMGEFAGKGDAAPAAATVADKPAEAAKPAANAIEKGVAGLK